MWPAEGKHISEYRAMKGQYDTVYTKLMLFIAIIFGSNDYISIVPIWGCVIGVQRSCLPTG
ncbi:hypothetical protein M422DRAFT_23245 [Sphaerobolus stellatus SS14]|nr:hypothetical protein M422DRAFT_23245 [Sphaerobolus stellatus SS14]